MKGKVKMPTYKSYPTDKETPSRPARKKERSNVFRFNKTVAAKLRKERRLARIAALEQEGTEE